MQLGVRSLRDAELLCATRAGVFLQVAESTCADRADRAVMPDDGQKDYPLKMGRLTFVSKTKTS